MGLADALGGGAAFLDYDNDGREDALVTCPGPSTGRSAEIEFTLKLLRNEGAESFSDVTSEVGFPLGLQGRGIAVADYDNDGKEDVFITGPAGCHLFHNLSGHFVDVTPTAGIRADDRWSTSALWFDYDNDGLLDLFVCGYCDLSCEGTASQGRYGEADEYSASWFNGTPNRLYKNLGNGHFRDVSEAAGIGSQPNKALGCCTDICIG